MEGKVEEFEALDLNVVAISYDQWETNEDFSKDNKLSYELLSDADADTVNALKIRNEAYEEGHPAYGVSRPGILVVDQAGKILLKRAEESYRDRPDLDEVLAAIQEAMPS